MKFALNFHAWGNMLVHPFSYLDYEFRCKNMNYSDSELKHMLKDTMCPVRRDERLLFYLKTAGQCSNRPESRLVDVRQAMSVYADIVDNGGLPKGFDYGNGKAMVEYSANGEASDWMFAKHGIYATSPELGSDQKSSEKFFIEDPNQVKILLMENYGWIRYTILKLLPSFEVNIQNVYEAKRVFLNQTNLILSLNVQKKETVFQE